MRISDSFRIQWVLPAPAFDRNEQPRQRSKLLTFVPTLRSRPMADDKTKRGPADRSRINVNEEYEVRYWTGTRH